MMAKALPNVLDLKYIRGMAYTLIGLSYVSSYAQKNVFGGGDDGTSDVPWINRWDIKGLMRTLADRLVAKYKDNRENGWYWYEDMLTYGNSMLPWALFEAYKEIQNKEYLDVAQESLKFLEDIYFRNGYFKPIGCKGWFRKGDKPADFDEQPIEAGETALMYFSAFKLLGDSYYLDRGLQTFNWYHGENSLRVKLIDQDTGGCYDGITEKGLNLNEGAESLVSYLMTALERNRVSTLC